MIFKRSLYLALVLFLACRLPSQSAGIIFPDLEGEALEEALGTRYKPRSVLSYDEARDRMYAQFDNRNDSVYCVYSGHRLYLDPFVVDPGLAERCYCRE